MGVAGAASKHGFNRHPLGHLRSQPPFLYFLWCVMLRRVPKLTQLQRPRVPSQLGSELYCAQRDRSR